MKLCMRVFNATITKIIILPVPVLPRSAALKQIARDAWGLCALFMSQCLHDFASLLQSSAAPIGCPELLLYAHYLA